MVAYIVHRTGSAGERSRSGEEDDVESLFAARAGQIERDVAEQNSKTDDDGHH